MATSAHPTAPTTTPFRRPGNALAMAVEVPFGRGSLAVDLSDCEGDVGRPAGGEAVERRPPAETDTAIEGGYPVSERTPASSR